MHFLLGVGGGDAKWYSIKKPDDNIESLLDIMLLPQTSVEKFLVASGLSFLSKYEVHLPMEKL